MKESTLERKILRKIKGPCLNPVVEAKVYDRFNGDDYFDVKVRFYLPFEYLGIPQGLEDHAFFEYVEGESSSEIDQKCLKLIRNIAPNEDFTWSLVEDTGHALVCIDWSE